MRALLLEYPNDPETFKTDGQFLFGKELLVAAVVKKGAVIKKVYLPEGEWIDFNNSKTVYEGEQWITYQSPLNTIPLFIKKGSIIPMMPVMNYIHEKENYLLSVHVYPANEKQQASFELYEDDGETLDYQKDIYAKTKFACLTTQGSYELKISARQDNGYTIWKDRNAIIKLHIARKPVFAVKGKIKLPFSSIADFLKNSEKDISSLSWSWDEKTGVCFIKMPDNGKETILSVIK